MTISLDALIACITGLLALCGTLIAVIWNMQSRQVTNLRGELKKLREDAAASGAKCEACKGLVQREAFELERRLGERATGIERDLNKRMTDVELSVEGMAGTFVTRTEFKDQHSRPGR